MGSCYSGLGSKSRPSADPPVEHSPSQRVHRRLKQPFDSSFEQTFSDNSVKQKSLTLTNSIKSATDSLERSRQQQQHKKKDKKLFSPSSFEEIYIEKDKDKSKVKKKSKNKSVNSSMASSNQQQANKKRIPTPSSSSRLGAHMKIVPSKNSQELVHKYDNHSHNQQAALNVKQPKGYLPCESLCSSSSTSISSTNSSVNLSKLSSFRSSLTSSSSTSSANSVLYHSSIPQNTRSKSRSPTPTPSVNVNSNISSGKNNIPKARSNTNINTNTDDNRRQERIATLDRQNGNINSRQQHIAPLTSSDTNRNMLSSSTLQPKSATNEAKSHSPMNTVLTPVSTPTSIPSSKYTAHLSGLPRPQAAQLSKSGHSFDSKTNSSYNAKGNRDHINANPINHNINTNSVQYNSRQTSDKSQQQRNPSLLKPATYYYGGMKPSCPYKRPNINIHANVNSNSPLALQLPKQATTTTTSQTHKCIATPSAAIPQTQTHTISILNTTSSTDKQHFAYDASQSTTNTNRLNSIDHQESGISKSTVQTAPSSIQYTNPSFPSVQARRQMFLSQHQAPAQQVMNNEPFRRESYGEVRDKPVMSSISKIHNGNQGLPESCIKVKQIAGKNLEKSIIAGVNEKMNGNVNGKEVTPASSESTTTTPEHNSISSISGNEESRDRDFLIDDEISDQPELVLSATLDQADLSIKNSLSELEALKVKQRHDSVSSTHSSPASLKTGSCASPSSPSTNIITNPTTFRMRPRPLSFVEGADGVKGLDSPSYRATCQDLIGIKTLLFRLQGILQNAETVNPFEHNNYGHNKFYDQLFSPSDPIRVASDADLKQENMDLKRQVVLMHHQLDDKERTIKLLQQQMAKYLNINEASQPQVVTNGIKGEIDMVNAACQTERCPHASGINPNAVSDGTNGMLVSSMCCTHFMYGNEDGHVGFDGHESVC